MLDSRVEVVSEHMSAYEPGAEERHTGRKAALLACVLGLIALVVGALFGNRGMLQLIQQREQTYRIERQIAELRHENGRLLGQIRALRSEPRAIERVAREQLGLARPGETLFLLQPEPLSATQ
jgi:cell division protein FtsB